MRECCDASEGNPLILIALVGGGFKVFGTEVSGKTGHPVLRIVAGVMGLFLLIFGLVGTSDFTSHQSGGDRPSRPLSIPAQTTGDAESSSPTRKAAVEIAHPRDSGQSGASNLGQSLTAAYYNNLGVDYYGRQDYGNAISKFSEAIGVDPNNGRAYYNRGLGYRQQGNNAQAQADFDKAKKLGFTPPQ